MTEGSLSRPTHVVIDWPEFLTDHWMKALDSLLGIGMETSFVCLHRAAHSLAAAFSQNKWSKEDCMPMMKATVFFITYSGVAIFYMLEVSHLVRPTLKGWNIKLYLSKGGISEFVDILLEPPQCQPWPGRGSSVRVPSKYIKIVDSIPCRGTSKKQPMNA